MKQRRAQPLLKHPYEMIGIIHRFQRLVQCNFEVETPTQCQQLQRKVKMHPLMGTH